jgi:hypothetical protein
MIIAHLKGPWHGVFGACPTKIILNSCLLVIGCGSHHGYSLTAPPKIYNFIKKKKKLEGTVKYYFPNTLHCEKE